MKAFLTEWSQCQTWPQEIKTDTPAGTTQDLDVTRQRIAGMGTEEFARAGLVVTVDSIALGESVIFASDNTPVMEQTDSLTVYRASELNYLAGMTVDQLQKVHALKKTFRASIEFIRPIVESA